MLPYIMWALYLHVLHQVNKSTIWLAINNKHFPAKDKMDDDGLSVEYAPTEDMRGKYGR